MTTEQIRQLLLEYWEDLCLIERQSVLILENSKINNCTEDLKRDISISIKNGISDKELNKKLIEFIGKFSGNDTAFINTCLKRLEK